MPSPAAREYTNMPAEAVTRPRAKMTSFVTDLAWFGFKLGFGLTSLATVWVTAVLKNGVLWAKDTDEEQRELAAAQQKYWNLDQQPFPGFRHAFFTTSTGTRLHYVTNWGQGGSTPQNIGIFIHGTFACTSSSLEHMLIRL
jgi:hypothetical protein